MISSWRKFRGWGWVPIVAWSLFVMVVVIFSPRSPTRLVFERAWAPPSGEVPWGAGDGGVDLFAAICHATVRGLALASVVTATGFVAGTLVGTWGGMQGTTWAKIVARICDVTQSFPTFLVALAVLTAVQAPGRFHLGVAFCLSSWAPFARMSLVQATVLVGAPFVEAARALGASPWWVLWNHVLPNLLGPVWIQAGSSAAAVVVGEASLGFVGLGPSDGVSLGMLLEQGALAMLRAPHVLIASALAIAITSGSLQWASSSLASGRDTQKTRTGL